MSDLAVQTRKALNVIDQNWNDEIRLLKDLVEVPSTLGNEEAAQRLVSDQIRLMGLRRDIWEPQVDKIRKRFPHFSPYSTSDNKSPYAHRPNVVGILKSRKGGRSLILNGHIDVVDSGSRQNWKTDPWRAIRKDNVIYGRGTSDMKSGLVAAVYALKGVIESDTRLDGDVIVQSVIDEEGGSAGTFACIAKGYRADAGIVPEPSGASICATMAGLLRFRINVTGRTAHGGERERGISAFEKAEKIHAALAGLERRRAMLHRHPEYKRFRNPTPINLGVIHSGSLYASVPDMALLEGRYGLLPGENFKQAMKEFEECVLDEARSDPWMREHHPKVEWLREGSGTLPPCEISHNEPIVKTTVESLKELGYMAEFSVARSANDSSLLSYYAKTPSFKFGPGDISCAHAPNEHVKLKNLDLVTKALALVIMKWCGCSSHR
jgi:acetylornithine deacetylase